MNSTTSRLRPKGLIPIRERQWGDFQTPNPLAEAICQHLHHLGCRPSLIIEPTAGQGNFLAAALTRFPEADRAIGVEIQPEYAFAARERFHTDPRVQVIQGDIFQYQFPEELAGGELLILGNPPWVTSAELSTLSSANLPVKQNYKGHAGLDARTGKANFDLGEAVLFRLLERFHQRPGHLALLVKQSVIRNLVQEQPRRRYQISGLRAYRIDAKREFGATVEASLLCLQLGAEAPGLTCDLYDWAEPERPRSRFGWAGDRFVADVDGYHRWAWLDGASPFTWRQGLKHDCTRVMELTPTGNDCYQNGLGEQVAIEPDALYPLLKGSDLKSFRAGPPRRSVPLTQTRIGEETEGLAERFPRLWAYLTRHQPLFDGRRSSIYRGQPPFALFGIGPYAFAPYKVAISGMYKRAQFVLVEPVNGRPVMLDDTCYYLGFESYKEALLCCTALNSEPVQGLLGALVFLDGKRPFTKELLMRIDLAQAIEALTPEAVDAIWARWAFQPREALASRDRPST